MSVTLFQLVIFFQDLHQDNILNAKKLFLNNKKTSLFAQKMYYLGKGGQKV